MAQPVIKTSMGEFGISERFTDAIELNGRILVKDRPCVLSAMVHRSHRGETKVRKLELLRQDIDWSKLKTNVPRSDLYVTPPASLRREMVRAILAGAESFIAQHPTIFAEAGAAWLRDEIDHVRGKLDEALEALGEAREALDRMKKFSSSPEKSNVYTSAKWSQG